MKEATIEAYCDTFQHSCNGCVLAGKGECIDLDDLSRYSDNEIDRYYSAMVSELKKNAFDEANEPNEDIKIEDVPHDNINHPNHYCREGAMECIDEMVLLFGKEVVKHFCLCNIWKYRYRSNDKNGEEDVKKSDRYVQIYRELCDTYE
jgi:hypothetical protein